MTAITKAYPVTDLMSVVRPNKGWLFDPQGVLTYADPGVPRPDYDPATLAFRGWRVEKAVTNQLTNPGWTGGVPGVPGTLPPGITFSAPAGLSCAVVAVGKEGGIPVLDLRVSGTPGASGTARIVLRSTTGATAAPGEVWCIRGGLILIAGALTNIGTITLRVTELSSGGTVLNGGGAAIVPAAGLMRQALVTGTRTMANGSTANAGADVACTVTSGQPIDVTLRIAALGLWKSTYAFSPSFPDTTGTSTRDADDLIFNDAARWMDQALGTVCLDFMPGQTAADALRGILAFDDGTSNNRVEAYLLDTTLDTRLIVSSGGVTQVSGVTAGAATLLARNTLRLSWGPAGTFMSLNGAAPATAAIAALPVGLSRLKIGNRGGATVAHYLNGWIGPRVAYFPYQYTDAAAPDGFTIRTR